MRARSVSTVVLTLLMLLAPTLSLGGAAAADDAEAPVVSGWLFNRTSFEPGDTFTVTFNVSDASNVRAVRFLLAHESGQTGYVAGFEGQNLSSGQHNASFTWLDDIRGDYNVSYVYAEDVHGNAGYVFASSGVFPASSPTRVFLGPSQVDVAITSFSGRSHAQAGEAALFGADLQNMGDRAVGPVTVSWYVDNVSVQSGSVPGLGSGERVWLSLDRSYAPGQHRIRVVADPGNALAEDDEGDNERSGDLRVSGNASSPPDLLVASLQPHPAAPVDGERVWVNASVGNAGTSAAGPFQVAFLVDGALRDYANLTGLGGGASTAVGFWWTTARGDHTLAVVADTRGSVNESDETNNAANVTVAVGPSPVDLVVLSLSVPAYLTEGEEAVVSTTLWNNGTQATGGFTVALLVDGATLSYAYVPVLGADETVEMRFNWVARPGFHDVSVVADVFLEVAESDERNNAAARTVYVNALPPADLAVHVLGVSRTWLRTDLGPLAPNPLHKREVTVEVSNLGPGPSAGGGVALWAEAVGGMPLLGNGSRVLVGTVMLPALPAGSSQVVTFTWDPVRFVGDVDLKASAWTWRPETTLANNQDTYRDFVLVGGTGVGLKL